MNNIDVLTFRLSGQTEEADFGQLHHGTVVLDGRRVPAALTEHWSGERRLIARDSTGRHVSTVLQPRSGIMWQRPISLTHWVAHSDAARGRD